MSPPLESQTPLRCTPVAPVVDFVAATGAGLLGYRLIKDSDDSPRDASDNGEVLAVTAFVAGALFAASAVTGAKRVSACNETEERARDRAARRARAAEQPAFAPVASATTTPAPTAPGASPDGRDGGADGPTLPSTGTATPASPSQPTIRPVEQQSDDE